MSQCPEHPLIMEKLDSHSEKLDSIYNCLTSGTDGRPGLLERVRNIERIHRWLWAAIGTVAAAASTVMVDMIFTVIQRGHP